MCISLVSDTEPLNPLEFPGWWECLLCKWGNPWWASIELQDACRLSGCGPVQRKTKPPLESWNFQPQYPSSGKGRRAGESLNDQSCVLYGLRKNLKSTGFGEPLGWWTHECAGGELQLPGDRSSCSWDTSRGYTMYLFTWLFIRIHYHILYYVISW